MMFTFPNWSLFQVEPSINNTKRPKPIPIWNSIPEQVPHNQTNCRKLRVKSQRNQILIPNNKNQYNFQFTTQQKTTQNLITKSR